MKARIYSTMGAPSTASASRSSSPWFANLRHNKDLDRFTLRSRAKVEAQWRLFCLVHNIEKLADAGYAA